jgi:anaerobic magnesium-protoporphyrin IX monomethyl ester cyclase
MATSVFLTTAPYSLKERYGRFAPIGSTLPSLGLLMLGASLRRAGFRVRIVDATAQGLRYAEVAEEVKRFRPDLIGISALTPSVEKAARLSCLLKKIYPSVPIVVGGPHFTARPEQTLRDYPGFDCGILGEGEKAVVNLAETLAAGRKPFAVPGVVYRDGKEIIFGPPAQIISDLDSLPFPAWDLLDNFPAAYHPAIFKFKKLPSTQIVSARGCPNNCIFCDNSVFGHRTRFHGSEYVLEMVQYLRKNFAIRDLIFEDDQFLIKKDRVEQICRGFLARKMNLSWSCSGRVDSINDLTLLKLMKNSGCWQINYGIESGEEKILEFAQKSTSIGQIEKALHLTRRAGIQSKGYFIFGLPGETEKTMAKTIRFAKRLPLSDVSVFMLTPFPGSKIYDIAEQYGTLEKDFARMNILNVVYVPNGLTKKKLIKYQKRFAAGFYLRPRIMGNYFNRLAANSGHIFRLSRGFLWGADMRRNNRIRIKSSS